MTATITAHGQTYTPQQARDRIAQLESENNQYGPSDGRVTEINALRAELPTVTVDTPAPGEATVVKETFEEPCEHPACYILHRRFLNTDFEDGWHIFETVNPATGHVTVTTETRYHMIKSTQWSVMVDGWSVESYDTKREATKAARRINR